MTETHIDSRMIKARSRLITSQPFFGTLALHLELVESTQFDTMATDGRHLFYNPTFLAELADDETMFVVGHEAYHCANKHHTRRNGRDHDLWNQACDYVVNADLIQAGVGRMPKCGLFDPQFSGLSAEDVYAILDQRKQQDQPQPKPQPKPEQGDDEGEGGAGQDAGEDQDDGDDSDDADEGDDAGDQDGEGDGEGEGQAGAGGDPGRCGQVLDASNSPAECGEQEAEWETITRQAVAVAAKAAGGIPASLERLVADLKKPRTDWREVLRRFVTDSQRFDFSWSNPDRRFGGASFILPGTVSDGVNHVAIAIDTSGSIDTAALERFRAEFQSVVDDGGVDRVTIVYCDTKVHNVTEIASGEPVTFDAKGGGGTSYRPVWQWLKDQDVSALIYFTDLDPNDGFGDEPHVPVLWAAFGDPRWLRRKIASVPFGEVIELAD